jgi:hypothetical protein
MSVVNQLVFSVYNFKVGLTFLRENKCVLKNCDTKSEPDFKNYEGFQTS